jgi:NADH-quinone oxidoreductase subunit J
MTLFCILGVVLVLSAVCTIVARQPVHSVVALLVNFAALAAMYISLSAEFLGLIQVVVYSGAILILFVFVIALLSSGVSAFEAGPNRLPRLAWPVGIVAALGFGLIAFTLTGVRFGPPHGELGLVGAADVFGSVADFGRALFGPYVLPFEVTALILMVAVIGVVSLAEVPAAARKRPVRRPHPPREPIVKAKHHEVKAG